MLDSGMHLREKGEGANSGERDGEGGWGFVKWDRYWKLRPVL